MEKFGNNADPKHSRSLLFRLLSGGAAEPPEGAEDEVNTDDSSSEAVLPPDMDVPPLAERLEESRRGPAAEARPDTVTEDAKETVAPLPENATQGSVSLGSPSSGSGILDSFFPEGSAPEEPEPVDAEIKVRIAPDGMTAYVNLTAPKYGGAEASPKAIRAALKDAGVVYGIQDRTMFEMAMSKPYGLGDIPVADGTPKEDGRNGELEERFPHEIDISPYQNGDGTVDFKRLNIVREIKAGTIICNLTPPTEGVPGTTVRGDTIAALPGRPKMLSRGGNTAISEDGLHLIAEKDGHLCFKEGHFNVETTFVVGESVDNNTGNITFCGDVLVKGDIREGYTVRSGGTVQVKGTVEGGSIFAEGDIIINGGFNGMKRGELKTQANVTSKFLQNGNIRAKGDIVSEAVINSILYCDGGLTVTKNKGAIVGGRCTVLRSVEAKVIGSDVNTPTQITVGLSPTVLAKKQELEQGAEEIEKDKDALAKNLTYLERCAKMGKLSDKNVTLQERCNKQKVLLMIREGKCKKQLEEVNATIEEAVAGSMVKGQTVYPSTKVSIKSQSVMTKTTHQRCVFRIEKGELIVGTY